MDIELQRLLDERACEALITDYTHLVDFGNAPGIAEPPSRPRRSAATATRLVSPLLLRSKRDD